MSTYEIKYPIILEGITGSQAYGLATEHSDTDIKGIYVAPTREILSLYSVSETIDGTAPDYCYHELGKFINLAMVCNPTILELLFLEGYTELTKFGKMLVDNRHLFLSNKAMRSYGGYALQQVSKLNAQGYFGNGRSNRYSKHARHCFRLLIQGRQLLETGELTVRVSPELREELFAVGELTVSELVAKFTEEYKNFKTVKSVLPDMPNKEEINKLLLRVRKGNY